MKPALIIGNWKSHKTIQETKDWFAEVAANAFPIAPQVVLCPPFPLLQLCKELVQTYQLPWKLGAQTTSSYPEGKYTGEVNTRLLRDFASYVLIGHSERRAMGETDEMLFEKVKRVNESGLIPIFFVQNEKTSIPKNISIVAYEPVFAIGTGHPDNPEDAEKVAQYFKRVKEVSTVLYGGSVDDKNVAAFMSCSSIDGIVPGTASLDPIIFSRLIHNA